jgi:RHS repeat-associated protein
VWRGLAVRGEPPIRAVVLTGQCGESGKERDAESGLDFFIARYYSSQYGRFLSPDEFTGGPLDAISPSDPLPPGPLPYATVTNPQSLNKYAYVWNNPLKYLDPHGHEVKEYLLLTSGPNQVPSAPHPEIPDVSELGPKETSRGGFFALNTQTIFDEGDDPSDYKPIREAYILGTEGEVLQERSGGQENPDKSQIANRGGSQYVYDSPGASVTGAPRASLNGKYDVAFSLRMQNKKTKEVSQKAFYYRVTLVFENGKMIVKSARAISEAEFKRITGKDKKEKQEEKKKKKKGYQQ